MKVLANFIGEFTSSTMELELDDIAEMFGERLVSALILNKKVTFESAFNEIELEVVNEAVH